jgi:hypothetical protein
MTKHRGKPTKRANKPTAAEFEHVSSEATESVELNVGDLEHVVGGTKGAVVQAGWNLAQNKKAA